jgi:DNA-directed RNA polymerase specialized sigma24 family protein
MAMPDMEARAELHERVWQLPAQPREAFILLWYGGRSHDEAAEVFGVDRSTVKRWWRSARARLAHVLPHTGPECSELSCAVSAYRTTKGSRAWIKQGRPW